MKLFISSQIVLIKSQSHVWCIFFLLERDNRLSETCNIEGATANNTIEKGSSSTLKINQKDLLPQKDGMGTETNELLKTEGTLEKKEIAENKISKAESADAFGEKK